MRRTIVLPFVSLLLVGSTALAAAPAVDSSLPLDVQCWKKLGLTESPGPGIMAGLVRECTDMLQAEQNIVDMGSYAARRKQTILIRRLRAKVLVPVDGTRSSSSSSVSRNAPLRLSPEAPKGLTLIRAREVLRRKRQWFNYTGLQRTAILAKNPNAVDECAEDMDVTFAECVGKYLGAAAVSSSSSSKASVYDKQHVETLSIGQTVTTSDGVTITFTRFGNDTRCENNVYCLWAGEASIGARVFSQTIVDRTRDSGLMAPRTLTIRNMGSTALVPPAAVNTVTVGKCVVAFAALSPFPSSSNQRDHVDDSQYRATFVVINPDGKPCAK